MRENDVDRYRRRAVQLAGLTIGGAVTGMSGVAGASESTEATEADEAEGDNPGLVTVRSDKGFEATVRLIKDRIEKSPLSLISTVDHAANAESAGLELPPTTLLIFGNPSIGTQLMKENRTVAIDLPQKLLIWCDDGTVKVTYNDPEYLAARHGIEGKDELLSQITSALRSLTPDQQSTDEDN